MRVSRLQDDRSLVLTKDGTLRNSCLLALSSLLSCSINKSIFTGLLSSLFSITCKNSQTVTCPLLTVNQRHPATLGLSPEPILRNKMLFQTPFSYFTTTLLLLSTAPTRIAAMPPHPDLRQHDIMPRTGGNASVSWSSRRHPVHPMPSLGLIRPCLYRYTSATTCSGAAPVARTRTLSGPGHASLSTAGPRASDPIEGSTACSLEEKEEDEVGIVDPRLQIEAWSKSVVMSVMI
jgi:hypothetical protein